MFAYTLPDGLPNGSRTVWSQGPLQPLAAGVLTPFSYSVLEEVARGAWYQYYDELGFAPMPRARVLRRYEGRIYLNLTLSAQREAEFAAVEPLTLLINEEPFPLVKWEKPGFLAGLKAGRNRKKIDTLLATYQQEVDAATQKAAAWYARTQELRWTQADVLQIMEEIERMGIASFKLFFGARHNLEQICNRLLWLMVDRQALPTNLALLLSAMGDLAELVESQLSAELLGLGEKAASDPATLVWLQAADFTDWQQRLPNRPLVELIAAFMARYGQRGVDETEIARPRWHEDPSLLFASLSAVAKRPPPPPATSPAAQNRQRFLAAVVPGARATAEQLVGQMQQLMALQSRSLHAFAYVLAGTRQWALAAAKEAMADGRLQQVDDLFFFALEEIKQMMTGEWNVSARHEIHSTCQQRRAEFAQWQRLLPPPLLVGDSPAQPWHQGLPGSNGEAVGPLCRWEESPLLCAGAIVGMEHLNSGLTLVLPLMRALAVATGAPLDPFVAAARRWHVPAVLGLGARYATLIGGAQTTVHGDSGVVEQ